MIWNSRYEHFDLKYVINCASALGLHKRIICPSDGHQGLITYP